MKIAGISPSIINFARKNKGTKAPILTGLDYTPDTIELTTKNENKSRLERKRNHKITSRIPTTIEHVDAFVKMHPEVSREDAIQDILTNITEETDFFENTTKKQYGRICDRIEKEYFEKAAKAPDTMVESLSDHKNTPSYTARKI